MMRRKKSLWGIFALILAAAAMLSIPFLLPMVMASLGEISCTIANNTECADTYVLYVKNATGGWHNAHAQNVSVATYPYGICCNADDIDQTVGTSCSAGTPFLELANLTNSHVGMPAQSSYTIDACISVTNRQVSCGNYSGSCPAGYACVASLSSSESGASNLTNAHIDGNCTDAYPVKVCCGFSNRIPTVDSILLNATSSANVTTDNLTVHFTSSDLDLENLSNFTDWRKEGASVAVLNMPFNINVSSIAAGAITDYSTYGNNGTLGGGNQSRTPAWTNSGKIGGAYTFDGVNDYVNISTFKNVHPRGALTLEAWIKTNGSGVRQTIIDTVASGYNGFILTIEPSGKVDTLLANASVDSEVLSNTILFNNTWYHLVFTWDGTTGANGRKIYINGVLDKQSTSVVGVTAYSTRDLFIGSNRGVQNFNGSIDEVRIYNRSLSPEQILLDYQAGVAGKHSSIISENETAVGDNWSVLVGSCDGTACGTALSNTVKINIRTPTTPTLLRPTNANTTVHERLTFFNWTSATYAEWYEINITSNNCADLFSNSTLAPQVNFTSTQELCVKSDSGGNTFYNWTVRACNVETCGSWATRFNFSIEPWVVISIENKSLDFGSMALGQNKNTTSNSLRPFILINDGNVIADLVNVSANQSLWQSSGAGLGTRYFQMKANQTNESGSFNLTASITDWINVSLANRSMIAGLHYNDSKDSAALDMNVEVPGDEPPGAKITSMVFIWKQYP